MRWLPEIVKGRRVVSYLRLLALFLEMCGELALRLIDRMGLAPVVVSDNVRYIERFLITVTS